MPVSETYMTFKLFVRLIYDGRGIDREMTLSHRELADSSTVG